MSESSWVLKGVDAAIRDKAVEEATRLGIDLSDYVTDMVLRSAISDQLRAAAEAEPTQPAVEDSSIFTPPPESPEGFAVRHRLRTLERRLGSAVGSLDGAVHALDSSLFDITARVGEVEALAGDTAHALGQTQNAVNDTITGLQLHLAVIEDNLAAQDQAQSERAAGLDQRIDQVELVAHGAERSASVLADAHEALKYAVAQDFADFTQETAERLSHGLHDVRAAADAAAELADAAVAHLVRELRTMREALDQRLEENAEDTRARMHEAFADAAERLGALAERVVDNERYTARVTEQLRGQIADVEDGAQTAIEETTASMRAADAALAADLSRASQEQHAALENARAALGHDIAAMREDQLSQLARLKLVDVAVGNTINDIAAMRDSFDVRLQHGEANVHAALAKADAAWSARFDAAATRADHFERETLQLRQTLMVEVERLETCTFAALEKLSRDIAAGDEATAHRIELAAQSYRAELDQVRHQAAADVAGLHEDHAGVAARLTLLDVALARVESASAPLDARLAALEAAVAARDPDLEARVAQLEYAAANAETDQALEIVRTDVNTLSERLEGLAADPTLANRLAQLNDSLDIEASRTHTLDETVQGVARMLNRVAAQSVEAAAQGDRRMHQIELAIADLRLETLATAEAAPATTGLDALEQRLAAFEARQAEALHTLRNDIARFIADNDQRLETLENNPVQDHDLATQFDALRQRVEERLLGAEQRSVRTLEQVADTVAMIERRFIQGGGDEALDARTG